ncbi:MAG: glutamate--tRNA ligase [Nanoarchaeota archaeon]|nr:glutamate--tRNA ligase [Nanoarchaeota archaeon]
MEEQIKKYALENAIKFNGKANPGAVIGSVIKDNPIVKNDLPALQKKALAIVKEINSLSLDEQKKQLESMAPELLEKKKFKKKDIFGSFKAEGDVVTAFPPEPSKYPHIGHAKALLINYEYAKRNNGKFILRFEDTNPKLAKEEFYKIHLDNYEWLGIKPDKIDYASDYMDKFYEFALKVIQSDEAYMCTCTQKQVHNSRMKGKACSCRNRSPEQNLSLWRDMSRKEEESIILRLKIDLKHKNSTMRDPTIFRIIKEPHVRLGTDYVVWPNYDFENAIMDGVEGVTYRFRSKEFEMRNELQRYIQKLLGFKETSIYEFARFNLEGVESSGRKIRDLIADEKLLGWDDPSLTTLVALKRRGFLPQAIKQFVLSTGITKADSTLTWDDLIIHNKRLLDSKCNRYFFIVEPVRITIAGAPNQKVSLKLHPDNPKKGLRILNAKSDFYITKKDYKSLKENELYRLMDCLNFKKKKNSFVFNSLDYESYKKIGDKIIHWLPVSDDLITVEVLMPDKKIIKGLAEPLVKQLKEGTVIKFERFGFCKLEQNTPEKLSFIYTHK